MFVDVGRVEDGDPEYLTWDELRTCRTAAAGSSSCTRATGTSRSSTGRAPDDYGPYYAYEEQGEDFDGWQVACAPTSVGPGHARRADPALSAARVRAAVRQLRPGRDERPADPRRSAPLAHRALRAVFTQDRTRWLTRARPAARPHPGQRSPPEASSTPSCCREPPRRPGVMRRGRRRRLRVGNSPRSARNRRRTWFLTVSGLRWSSAAICLVEHPCSSRRSTST